MSWSPMRIAWAVIENPSDRISCMAVCLMLARIEGNSGVDGGVTHVCFNFFFLAHLKSVAKCLKVEDFMLQYLFKSTADIRVFSISGHHRPPPPTCTPIQCDFWSADCLIAWLLALLQEVRTWKCMVGRRGSFLFGVAPWEVRNC